VGVIVGGILIRKMNLQVGGMLKLMAVCHVVALITLTTFLVQCPPRSFVGINVDYNNKCAICDEKKLKTLTDCRKVMDTSASSLLDADCNSNCDCSNDWNPVCHVETSTSYYSACHAGCTVRHRFNNSVSVTRANMT
jgi:organic anion transporter 4A